MRQCKDRHLTGLHEPRTLTIEASGSLREEQIGSKSSMAIDPTLMFAYWGRRGPLAQLTLELAHAVANKGESITFSVSTSNELYDRYALSGNAIFPIRTFRFPHSALNPAAIIRFRRDFRRRVERDGTRAFVNLMAHVWSPTLLPIIRQNGIRHTIVVHEARPHTGERAALVYPWLLREAKAADQVVTLSKAIAEELSDQHGISPERISVLFHPDLTYGDVKYSRRSGGPLRLLFFGRLLPYKGLDLFLDALEILRSEGTSFSAGIFGTGNVSAYRTRMRSLGVEVEDRWIPTEEIAAIFSRHDVVVLCHTVASQSGIIAAAHGASLPVIVPPVGGLTEQVVPGITGLVAKSADASGIAAEIRKIIQDPDLLARMRRGIDETKPERSVERFFDELTAVALKEPITHRFQ
jgi:glycosyltransferase involved in cell wall biosynthesis